jgi:PAS domain-containing protein
MPAEDHYSESQLAELTRALAEARSALQEQTAECQRLEQVLQSGRNFVTAVLNTVGALVAVVDREGRIVRFNRASEQILGYRFEEVKGRPFWELMPLASEMSPPRPYSSASSPEIGPPATKRTGLRATEAVACSCGRRPCSPTRRVRSST